MFLCFLVYFRASNDLAIVNVLVFSHVSQTWSFVVGRLGCFLMGFLASFRHKIAEILLALDQIVLWMCSEDFGNAKHTRFFEYFSYGDAKMPCFLVKWRPWRLKMRSRWALEATLEPSWFSYGCPIALLTDFGSIWGSILELKIDHFLHRFLNEISDVFLVQFWSVLGSILGSFWRPKGDQHWK